MITRIRGTVGLLLLFGVGLIAPGYAVAEPGARLYELTENMGLKAVRKVEHRLATSELMGFAAVGTPLCPKELVDPASPGATFCTINATGNDNIDLSTGKGKFWGTFTVVIQGDNAVDSPEFVVANGRFRGQMDFSPAVVYTIPLGSVTGKLQLVPGGYRAPNDTDDGDVDDTGVPFTGIFRLPFVLPTGAPGCDVDPSGANCFTPALYLLNAPDPLPVDFSKWQFDPVKNAEKALDWPTVRFEISF